MIELFLPVLCVRCFVSYLCLLNIHCSELMSQYLGIGHIFPQLLLSFSLLLLCNLANISLFDWSTTPTTHPSRYRLPVKLDISHDWSRSTGTRECLTHECSCPLLPSLPPTMICPVPLEPIHRITLCATSHWLTQLTTHLSPMGTMCSTGRRGRGIRN